VAVSDAAGNYAHGYGYGYAQPGPAPVQGYSAQVVQQSAKQSVASNDNSFVGGQCHFVQATIIKSIHAVCVSSDGHQFPASHMTPDTWINSGYEGEVARCLPGSTLRVLVGSVMQSNQGMATTYEDAEALMCGAGKAVRHFKDGMLKCAPAEKVVDCTERTNLRKYGTGDMFFTYVTQVCLKQHQQLVGGQTKESSEAAAARAQSYAKAQATSGNAAALHLSGMSLGGGVGGLGFYLERDRIACPVNDQFTAGNLAPSGGKTSPGRRLFMSFLTALHG
jgi:hypothetical protein